jgi:parvulin-like peptidyl-prolyl isomerase
MKRLGFDSAVAVAALAVWALLAQGAQGEIVNGIAAKVGRAVITINEFNKAYNNARTQALLLDSEVPSKKAVMDGLVDDILVRMEGERRGIVVTDDEVNGIINDIKTRNKFDDAQMNQQLALEGLTLSDLKAQYRKELIKARLLNLMGAEKNPEITDADVRSFYDDPANRESLSLPGTVSVTLSQVLVAVSEGAAYREALDAKNSAASVYERAVSGEDFQSLILERSSYPDKAAMGTFTREQLLALFSPDTVNAILSLDEGGVLPPIRVKEGYSVIRVDKKNPETMLSFDEVRESIRGYLAKKKGEEQFSAWIKDKRRITKIEYLISME